MANLRRAVVRGFKSIKDLDLSLQSLNILIGANGVGKSNLVSFFKMLNEMMGSPPRLQSYIATAGRATSILHFGPRVTPQMEAMLEFDVDNGVDFYQMRLFHAAGDTLVFAEETLRFQRTGWSGPPQTVSLGAGHLETRVIEEAERGDKVASTFRHLLHRCRVYHFHDTSPTARVRQHCYIGDNRWLMHDAGNLAAVLYRLSEDPDRTSYNRIVSTIQQVAPFFGDFELAPTSPGRNDVILNWRQRDSDQVFGPHQLSDGTLRAICLITLLLQPVDKLPYLVVVDEPELGLHPYALNVVASLFKKASHHRQILISTQSSSFLDSFEPEDVIVVEQIGKESLFKRLEPEALNTWLDDYSLGEVWEKNVIGGGPH